MNKRIRNKRKVYSLLFDDNGSRISVYVVAKSIDDAVKMILEVCSTNMSPTLEKSYHFKGKNKWSGFISPCRKRRVYKWLMSYNRVGFTDCTQSDSLSFNHLFETTTFVTYKSRLYKINKFLKKI